MSDPGFVLTLTLCGLAVLAVWTWVIYLALSLIGWLFGFHVGAHHIVSAWVFVIWAALALEEMERKRK